MRTDVETEILRDLRVGPGKELRGDCRLVEARDGAFPACRHEPEALVGRLGEAQRAWWARDTTLNRATAPRSVFLRKIRVRSTTFHPTTA